MAQTKPPIIHSLNLKRIVDLAPFTTLRITQQGNQHTQTLSPGSRHAKLYSVAVQPNTSRPHVIGNLPFVRRQMAEVTGNPVLQVTGTSDISESNFILLAGDEQHQRQGRRYRQAS
jgi:hypothetical protein